MADPFTQRWGAPRMVILATLVFGMATSATADRNYLKHGGYVETDSWREEGHHSTTAQAAARSGSDYPIGGDGVDAGEGDPGLWWMPWVQREADKGPADRNTSFESPEIYTGESGAPMRHARTKGKSQKDLRNTAGYQQEVGRLRTQGGGDIIMVDPQGRIHIETISERGMK
jgi:hypothetical protein